MGAINRYVFELFWEEEYIEQKKRVKQKLTLNFLQKITFFEKTLFSINMR